MVNVEKVCVDWDEGAGCVFSRGVWWKVGVKWKWRRGGE